MIEDPFGLKDCYKLNEETVKFLIELDSKNKDIIWEQANIFFLKGNEIQINNYIRYAREMLYCPDVEFEKQENVLKKLTRKQQCKWAQIMTEVMGYLLWEEYANRRSFDKFYTGLFQNNPLTERELYDLVYTSFSYCEYAIEQACKRV